MSIGHRALDAPAVRLWRIHFHSEPEREAEQLLSDTRYVMLVTTSLLVDFGPMRHARC